MIAFSIASCALTSGSTYGEQNVASGDPGIKLLDKVEVIHGIDIDEDLRREIACSDDQKAAQRSGCIYPDQSPAQFPTRSFT